ncbi:MAG: hypothetical protein A2V66_17155 [Ignavibacteria bacterium RBG_13_36_8]|nr:MAG: hypothetical protein A2V66_17155 [Ignavibacteria bacterium RBG_13_36_8]
MISTKRTLLKLLSVDNAKDLYAYRSLPEVYKYQSWFPKNISDAEDFIKDYSSHHDFEVEGWKQFGIFLIEDNTLIGDCGCCIQPDNQAEIGYTISPQYQRKGLGSEVVESLINFLFRELSLRKIIAKTDPENIGSIKVLEKFGFRKEAHLVRSVQIRGEWKDDLVYVILREDWIKDQ